MMDNAVLAMCSQLKHDVRALSEAKKSPWGISVGEAALPLHRFKG